MADVTGSISCQDVSGSVSVGPIQLCAEYQDVYDAQGALGSYPSVAERDVQNYLVNYWKFRDVWDDMSFVHILNTHTNDGGQALLDWKLPVGGDKLNVNACENGPVSGYDVFSAVGMTVFNSGEVIGGLESPALRLVFTI